MWRAGVLCCALTVRARSYTKPKGQLPDYETPVILRRGRSSMENFCNRLHRAILHEFK